MEGRGDTIKMVLGGFDPKLAGALVAGALQQKSMHFKNVWEKKSLQHNNIGEAELIHMSRHCSLGGKKKILYHVLYFYI